MPTPNHTTKPSLLAAASRVGFRAGYERAKRDAIDRCRVEQPGLGSMGGPTIARCIDAIGALDVRHALASNEGAGGVDNTDIRSKSHD